MDNGFNDKISIIMGIYNCEEYLRESIDSIINQTYSNWELIMCDDGSSDNTLEIAREYEKKYPDKIRVLVNEKNMGLNFTLNKCLEQATGYYIARQDGDDISLPDRFEKEINFLKSNPQYSLVSSNMIFFDENGDWGESHNFGEVKKENFLKGSPICHAPCMIRTEDLKSVGGYTVDKKLLRVEDYHLWFKLFIQGYKCYSLKESLYKMRDDNNAYKRRTFRNRLNETRLKLWGFHKIKISLTKYFWAFKPLILFFVPKCIYSLLHKNKLMLIKNSKLKVAQFVGTMNCGGTETMLMNLFRNIDKEKYEFVFIEDSQEKSWYDDEIEKIGGRIVHVKSLKSLGLFKYIKQLKDLFKNEKFDVVHSHVFLHSGFVMLAARMAGIRSRISHSHSAMRNNDVNFLKKMILRFLIVNNSTKLAACSTEAGNFLFGKRNFKRNGVLLPNPVLLTKINNISDDVAFEMKKNYDINNKILVIGHVGRLIDVKNHRFMISLAKKLKNDNFNFRMFFLGDGPLKEEINYAIEKEGLSDCIIMTGNVSNVYEYMKMFDILILPSLYEGLPVTLVESQASGLYSIVSDKVSKESDLGLDLVQFESIDDVNIWADIIKRFKKKKISKTKITEVIEDKGFSERTSLKLYDKLYSYSDKKRGRLIIPFLIASLLAILAYFFQPRIGYDLCSYNIWIQNMKSFNGSDVLNYIFYNGEFISMFYIYIISRIGNVQLLQVLPTFLIYFIILYIIFDYCKMIRSSRKSLLLIMILSLSLFKYVFAVSSFRYILAYCIFSLAVYKDLVKKEKSFLCYALYVVPIFIHISSILLILIRMLFVIKNTKLRLLFFTLMFFVFLFPRALFEIFGLFSDTFIIDYFLKKMDLYFNVEYVSMNLQYFFRILQTLFFLLICLITRFDEENESKLLFYSFFEYATIFTLGVFMHYSLFMRLSDFIIILSPVVLYNFFRCVKLYKKIYVFSILCIILFIIGGIRIQIPIFMDMYDGKEYMNESNICIYTNVQ